MELKTFDLGPIRPTSESHSLLIRVTKGCQWNQCKFCNNYRDMQFSLRPLETLKEEIDIMAQYRDLILSRKTENGLDMEKIRADYRALKTREEKQCYDMLLNWITGGEYSVFLQDADAIVLSNDKLVPVLRYIREKLPETTRITSYARPDTLARKTLEELKELKEAGLDRIHSGFETGSDIILERISKGVTSEQQIEGGRKTMQAGIELSVFLMFGIGGRALSDENADQTARVIRAVDPSFVRLRTAVVIKGTPLWQEKTAGLFDECTDIEQLLEMRRFIEKLEGCTGYVYSDHIINLLGELEGPLTDISALLRCIDEFLALDENEIRRYQLARRMGFNDSWKRLHLLRNEDQEMIDRYCSRIPKGEAWEEAIKELIRRYI